MPHIEHPTKRAFVELLYLLGIRPGQLKSTEASNVRVERGKVVALVYRPAQVKQRVPHGVPLVGRAQEVVQELWAAQRLGCRLLFQVHGKPLRELKCEWRRACEAAGIVAGRKRGGLVIYNLRHSCLTNLAVACVGFDGARHQRTQDRLGAQAVCHHAGVGEGSGARRHDDGGRGAGPRRLNHVRNHVRTALAGPPPRR